MPAAHVKRRGNVAWVVIEEPEMGLHPSAISIVLLLVLELLWRGYKVCLSTHSPHVLDVVWALRHLRKHRADPDDLLGVFSVKKTEAMRRVAKDALGRSARVFYFDPSGKTRDISELDPGSADATEAGWGGLSEFSGRVADVVAKAVNGSRA
jgi:hypothetical protein